MSTPPVQTINASDVGSLYHVGFGYTDPSNDVHGNSGFKSYGYMLVNGTQYTKKTNVQAQGQLIQASPNLTDRDLVVYPRINDGDFSGGGLQEIFIDPHKYYDSDLEIRTPGSLTLRPALNRFSFGHNESALDADGRVEIISFNGDAVVTFHEQNGNVYNSAGVHTATIPVNNICTDSGVVFATDLDGNVVTTPDLTTWSTLTITPTLPNPFSKLWFVNQGTAGRFLYYCVNTTGAAAVFGRVDLATNTSVTLPTANQVMTINDVCEYGGGIAMTTNDSRNGPGSNIWFHDGNNMQLILRLGGYIFEGICNCLGNLFATAIPITNYDAPILIQVSGGSFNIVATLGIPTGVANPSALSGPVASGQYVAFTQLGPFSGATAGAPPIKGVSPRPYVWVYDALAQSISHIGNVDANDNVSGGGIRQVAFLGRAVVYPPAPPGVGQNLTVQYQSNQNAYTPNPVYATTGRMVSSRIDFNTPGIVKMFRRVLVHHAALNAGEQIQVQAFVNLDPTTWTQSTTATGSVTNSTVGSTDTVLVLPQHTTGFSMVFVLTLTAGTNNATTPTIYYVSTQIAVPWVWEMTLDCTSKRKILGNIDDPQGLLGQDLFFLLHNAWELAQPLTMYSPEGVTYTVEVQDFKSESISPQAGRVDPTKVQDFESHVTITVSESVV